MFLPFKAEYAKSGKSKCRQCWQNIENNSCRLAVVEASTLYDGRTFLWYHLQCFFVNHVLESVALINGFPCLRLSDQDFITNKIAEQDAKRSGRKRSSSTNGNNNENKKPKDCGENQNVNDLERAQSVEYYALHDQLKQHLKQKDWLRILTANSQYVPRGPTEILKHVTDIIYFGAINSCSKCGKRMFIFRNNAYFCHGDLSGFTKCDNILKKPSRAACLIPSDLKEEHSFLNENFEVKHRIIKVVYTPKKQGESSKMIARRSIQPLSFQESSSQVRLNIKNGSAVDPSSFLQDIAHVYRQHRVNYFAVLTKVDVKRNTNSFYKIQLLESDDQNNRRYWLFRSYGRTATDIGDTKLDNFNCLDEAMQSFLALYKKKTNNDFGVDEFVKHPGLYYNIDIDYGQESELNEPDEIINDEHESQLETSVQNLVKLMFDVDAMKKKLSEFNLDLKKMPLGKISKKLVIDAMIILSEIYNQIEKKEEPIRLVESSNQFYSLIPHDVGVGQLPIINTIKQFTDLSQHLEELLEIIEAYDLMHQNSDVTRNSIDANYRRLNTEITPMNRSEEEFQLLEEYVANTHGETHSHFDLEIDEIFRISRQGENERFEPYKNFHNRYLLWHGSRLTNFTNILSQGLRIAPPEAPPSGYMFGKGIYFADMASKSANYCYTDRSKGTGLMLLCEVALGNMLELNRGNQRIILPSGMHSVKGIGKTYPNETHLLNDDIIVPKGKLVTDSDIATELLYNEYIVYNADQVKIKYLLKMNFKHKD